MDEGRSEKRLKMDEEETLAETASQLEGRDTVDTRELGGSCRETKSWYGRGSTVTDHLHRPGQGNGYGRTASDFIQTMAENGQRIHQKVRARKKATD